MGERAIDFIYEFRTLSKVWIDGFFRILSMQPIPVNRIHTFSTSVNTGRVLKAIRWSVSAMRRSGPFCDRPPGNAVNPRVAQTGSEMQCAGALMG